MYEITLKIKGENQIFKRTDEPFLKNITQALILSQHQSKMYGKDGGPTDKDFNNNSDEVAQFAVNFWNKQFSKEDVINGANAEAMATISSVLDECLGVQPDEESDGESDSKKSPSNQSKNQ